jgi:membrane protein implicated in regulation of membrane protease activity
VTENDPPRSKHPFRDSVIMYAILSVIIIVVAPLTGGGFARAVVFAVVFFVAATAWSWWRYRRRVETEGRG